jgi:hypothetical protein
MATSFYVASFSLAILVPSWDRTLFIILPPPPLFLIYWFQMGSFSYGSGVSHYGRKNIFNQLTRLILTLIQVPPGIISYTYMAYRIYIIHVLACFLWSFCSLNLYDSSLKQDLSLGGLPTKDNCKYSEHKTSLLDFRPYQNFLAVL